MTALVLVYAFMEFIYGIRKKDRKAFKRAGIAVVIAIVIDIIVFTLIN